MSNCKHLKLKLDRTLECKLTGKKITWIQCKNCKLREFKINNSINAQYNVKKCKKNAKMHNISQKQCKLKQRTAKLNKLERNRSSLFTQDTSKCMFCGSKHNLTWHEIYPGRNRRNSIKYKLCLRMCLDCHEEKQEDIEFNNYWKQKGQLAFITNYPDLDFVNVFKRNYL